MKLSLTQKKVLTKMERGKWHSSYNLGCSISTLEALHDKGYVHRKSGLGSTFSPTTDIEFKKKRE